MIDPGPFFLPWTQYPHFCLSRSIMGFKCHLNNLPGLGVDFHYFPFGKREKVTFSLTLSRPIRPNLASIVLEFFSVSAAIPPSAVLFGRREAALLISPELVSCSAYLVSSPCSHSNRFLIIREFTFFHFCFVICARLKRGEFHFLGLVFSHILLLGCNE